METIIRFEGNMTTDDRNLAIALLAAAAGSDADGLKVTHHDLGHALIENVGVIVHNTKDGCTVYRWPRED